MKRYTLMTSFLLFCAIVSFALLAAPAADSAASQTRGDDNTQSDMHQDMAKMNKMMVMELGQKHARYEAKFIDMMIPHHEGAVMMAEHALKHANRPELKALAKKMIESQNKEIEQLKKWRKQWYPDDDAYESK